MNETFQKQFNDLWYNDRDLQNKAFFHFLEVTKEPVGWAYEVWDQVVENLSHKDNHNRAIASQILCNLAKSDPEDRILDDFDALLAVTKDKRFVTARHCLQAIWKVGLAGETQQKVVINGLADRFEECADEKNYTLIRYDIIQGLRNLYDEVKDEKIKEKALELIKTEQNLKYQKKYAKVWETI